jgi:hypothetical protein
MRSRASHSLAATLVLAVWILAPVLAVIHVALEDHIYCAEHQRLEEGSDAHSAVGDSAMTQADAKGSQTQSFQPRSEESAASHEGCAFGEDFTREGLRLEHRISAEPALMASDSEAIRLTGNASSGIPLLLSAPKNSPPSLIV